MKPIIILLLLGIITQISSEYTNDTSDTDFIAKFKVTQVKPGTGNLPNIGNKVNIHYTGRFPDTNKIFDTTLELNEPLTFKLGKAEIKCFDEVVKRMKKGERVKVICPYELAFGENGAGGVIPPKTDLMYEIILVHIERTQDPDHSEL